MDEHINAEAMLGRSLLSWLGCFPELPEGGILYGRLKSGAPGMALGFIQEKTVKARDILGGYEAERRFTVTYRVRPGDSTDRRLKAEELLNRLGDWAERQSPELGPGLEVLRLNAVNRAAPVKTNEGGEEDYQIELVLRYKVKSKNII